MDQVDTGAQPAPEAPPIVDDGGTLTPSEAGRLLAQQRYSKPAEPAPETAAPAIESPAQAEDAAAETPPGETLEDNAAEELPPIDPPRSWTKEDKELFTGLPRDTQERLSERERSRERDFSHRQQEVTEKSKAIEAERLKTEQVRQQYETALPILLQNLQAGLAGEFADIRTMADVQKMSVEDPARYIRWDAQQRQTANVQQELQAAENRKQQDRLQEFTSFAKKQDDLFTEKFPDQAERKRLQDAAIPFLKDQGFDEAEMHKLWNVPTGDQGMSLRDARVQAIIADAIKWRDAQAGVRNLSSRKAPVPPVQRPGTARPAGADNAAEIQRLNGQLGSGNLTARQQAEVGLRLLQLQRRKTG